MKFFIVLLMVKLASPARAALEMEGFVCTTKNGLIGIRQLRSNAPCDMAVFPDPIAREDIRSLEAGDWVSFFGASFGAPVRVEIESVQTVGLNRLLGRWEDEWGNYFRFYSYNSFSLTKNSGGKKKTRSFEYELYPNTRDSWRILLVEGERVASGRLNYMTDESGYWFEFCWDQTKTTPSYCSTLTRPQ